MSNQGFGKPKYGSNTFAKTIRLKEGAATVARILPPMKSLADTGEWAVYLGTHFGYKGVNSKDKSKPTYRPFKCVQNRDYKTKMILQDCPECDLISQRQEDLKALEAEMKAKGHSEDEVKELSAPLKDWLSDHNCDRKWHMNVKQQDGSFAVLQISHKTKKLLEAEITRVLTEDGIEALDLNQGVWFRFNRTGKGIETQDTVSVEYESVRDATTGRVVRTVKLAPLTEAECEKALKECPDLSKNLREISYEQIKLLTQCSGDDEEVDAILAMGEKKEASPGGNTAVQAPASTPAAPKPAPTEADLQAQIAALTAQLSAQKPAVVAQPTPVSDAAPAAAAAAPVAPTPAATPAAGLPVDRNAFMARFTRPKAA
jgi:hypothetical protein